MDSKQLKKLIGMFKNEAADHIAALNRNLLALERNSTGTDRAALLEAIFRDAHSMKGAARAVGFELVETLSHALENVLSHARDGELELNADVCDVLYQTLDVMENILKQSSDLEEIQMPVDEVLAQLASLNGNLDEGDWQTVPEVSQVAPVNEPAPLSVAKVDTEVTAQPQFVQKPPAEVNPVPSSGLDETIRVNISRLESLMAQASELLIFKITSEQRLKDLKETRSELRRQHNLWRKYVETSLNGTSYKNSEVRELLEMNRGLFKLLTAQLGTLEHSLANDTLRLGMVVDNVQSDIRQTRMLPFSMITGGFRRLVRDLSHQLGKQIVFEVNGESLEVDKKILEEVREPVMHLLRNAIDHGLETPEAREANQKDPQGRLQLNFGQHGNMITIDVIDDGRGINLEAVGQAALQAGLTTAQELQTLTVPEVARFILMPGLSTNNQITSVSGRGVGLDVVRCQLETLHGQIEIETGVDRGTSFRLIVPLTLATTHGMLVRVKNEIYALPINSVQRILMFKPADISLINDQETIMVNDRPVALRHLSDVLDVPESDATMLVSDGLIRAVLLVSGESELAFVIDEPVGEQEMVIKNLGQQLLRVRNVAGATLMGSGDVVIILNVAELIRSAKGVKIRTNISVVPVYEEEDMDEEITILVVDDSITTRTLEKNILEAAGYKVVTAMDGTEAMRYLENNTCDLIVSDVQMPHMDGIALTSVIRQNSQLASLPLILVTSLESPADRKRGLEAGADAYIVKSGFDQEDLLTTIKQLV